MRPALPLFPLVLLLSSPAVGQEEPPPDEEAGLAEPAPPPAPVDDDDQEGDDDDAPADAMYERAEGEGYERHDYRDEDDGYATGRRRTRRAEPDDGYDDYDRADDGEAVSDDGPADGEGEEEGGRRRRGEDGGGKSDTAGAAAPNPWLGPAVVGLCALGGGCACLSPIVCLGTSPTAGPLAAILAVPALVTGAVAGSGGGGVLHLLFADGVGALPCIVAPIAAFVLAGIFGGLGAVAGLLVGTTTENAPLGTLAAVSVLLPGVLAVAAGAGATYSGVAFLMAPAEGGGEAADAGEGAPPPAEGGASREAAPARRRIAHAMVY